MKTKPAWVVFLVVALLSLLGSTAHALFTYGTTNDITQISITEYGFTNNYFYDNGEPGEVYISNHIYASGVTNANAASIYGHGVVTNNDPNYSFLVKSNVNFELDGAYNAAFTVSPASESIFTLTNNTSGQIWQFGPGPWTWEFVLNSGAYNLTVLNENAGSHNFALELIAPVPIPGAVWLFGSGLLGLVGLGRKRFKK